MIVVLIALVSATQTSTAPEWARPATIPEEDPEKERLARRARRAHRKQEQSFELENIEREHRWARDRGVHFALHAGPSFTVADGLSGGVDAALGFYARLSRAWSLQGRAAIGGGYGSTPRRIGGPLAGSGDGGPVFEAGVDASFRVGPNRFFFGLGPFGRLWKLFVSSRGFEYAGGGMVEFGWWFGKYRQIELVLRVMGGPAVGRGSELQPFVGTALGVGWIL